MWPPTFQHSAAFTCHPHLHSRIPHSRQSHTTAAYSTATQTSIDIQEDMEQHKGQHGLRSRSRKGVKRREAKRQRREQRLGLQQADVQQSMDETTLPHFFGPLHATSVTLVNSLEGIAAMHTALFDDDTPAHAGNTFPWRRLIALDCEWQPFRHLDSKTHVSLLQLATDDGRVWLVDMLAVMCPLPNLLGLPDSLQGGNGLCWTREPTAEEEAFGKFLSYLLQSQDIVKVGFRLETDLQRLMESYPIMPHCWGPTQGIQQLLRQVASHIAPQTPSHNSSQSPSQSPQIHSTRSSTAQQQELQQVPQQVAQQDAHDEGDVSQDDSSDEGAEIQDLAGTAESDLQGSESDDETVGFEQVLADCWLVSQSIEGGAHGGLATESLRESFIIRDLAGGDRLQPWHNAQQVRCVLDVAHLARRVKGITAPQLRRQSLKTLCERELNIVIDKQQQCSDWAARPLTTQQVQYAALDVLAVVAIADKLLHQHLRQRGEHGIRQLWQSLTQQQGALVSAGSYFEMAVHPSMVPPKEGPSQAWILEAAAAQSSLAVPMGEFAALEVVA